MNPYKVNTHHHFNKEMSADLVEEIDCKGNVKWDCYLFAAGAVTPMRVVEFGSCDEADKWAKDKGAEIWTYYGLDRDNPAEWPLDNPFDQITRDNEGNIIAGRQRAKARKEFKPGQTIDIRSCLETTMNSIISDVSDLRDVEYVPLKSLLNTPIVFVDSNGNQYEYDGVCISEDKLKVAIKPNKPFKPLATLHVHRKYFNFENQKTIDLLPFNQETLEKIRLERECMEKDVEGSIMNRSQIWHYLSNGFTITTYQADYVLEGHDFAYDEITKK